MGIGIRMQSCGIGNSSSISSLDKRLRQTCWNILKLGFVRKSYFYSPTFDRMLLSPRSPLLFSDGCCLEATDNIRQKTVCL